MDAAGRVERSGVNLDHCGVVLGWVKGRGETCLYGNVDFEWRCKTHVIEVWWFEKAAVRLLGCLCLHVLDAVGVDAVYA
jgi:hypothetical protein